MGEIIIYKAEAGPELQIKLENETVWLTLQQMADLFQRDRSVIGKHIRKIYKEAELSQNSTGAFFALVQKEGDREIERQIEHYNLDMIISVGYRVNSKRGTQFRIWATQRLRDYLLKGFLINEKRLQENQNAKLKELQQANKLISEAVESRRLEGYEKDLLAIITDYTNTWITLNEYDSGSLDLDSVTKKSVQYPEYEKVKKTIERFKLRLLKEKEASDLFGQEVGNKLYQVLGNIGHVIGGKDLYVSLDEKAAHLLYFAVKDHPFVDGNKRIGALLFILFLVENHYLLNRKGERKINDSALTALTLLVAESKPASKDVMIKLIVNLINKK
ncbi:MAG: virulence protein RhuM/Fic/DOC family protein [Candidatus Doudnabacteria bacterium]|nr:virulence protein RhuM/Fic/DOC family protein [Candidatus Doudnabacteria bacterium]